MPITNPTPVTAGVFNQLYVISFTCTANVLNAILVPTDGTYLLGNPSQQKRVQMLASDVVAGPLILSLVAQLAAASKETGIFLSMTVSSPDPAKPITLSAVYNTGVSGAKPVIFNVSNLATTLASNSAFQTAYNNVISYLQNKLNPVSAIKK